MTKNTQIDHIMPCAGSSGSKAKTDPMATQNQTAPKRWAHPGPWKVKRDGPVGWGVFDALDCPVVLTFNRQDAEDYKEAFYVP